MAYLGGVGGLQQINRPTLALHLNSGRKIQFSRRLRSFDENSVNSGYAA